MSRVIPAFTQFLDGSGDPLAYGWLRFLESGTTNTDKNTYSDNDQTIANTNPLQLDGDGKCPDVFGVGNYRVILYTYNELTEEEGVVVSMFDPVRAEYTAASSGTNFTLWDASTNYQIGTIITSDYKTYYRSLINDNLNNSPSTDPASWEELELMRVWNENITYLEDEVCIHEGVLYFSESDANLNNEPPNATYWRASVGDMLVATYDPGGVGGDAFDADNQVVAPTGWIASTDVQAALAEIGARNGPLLITEQTADDDSGFGFTLVDGEAYMLIMEIVCTSDSFVIFYFNSDIASGNENYNYKAYSLTTPAYSIDGADEDYVHCSQTGDTHIIRVIFSSSMITNAVVGRAESTTLDGTDLPEDLITNFRYDGAAAIESILVGTGSSNITGRARLFKLS